jgi:hypothetical protein
MADEYADIDGLERAFRPKFPLVGRVRSLVGVDELALSRSDQLMT